MGLKDASSSLLHALRAGSPFRRRNRNSHRQSAQAATSIANASILQDDEQRIPPQAVPNSATRHEPAIASLAHLTEMLSTYMDSKEIDKVREAYRFADQAHLGQFRSSGAPYITHPIAVTEICAGWKLDSNALMAALLHDVIEDQNVSKAELAEKFNPDVANLVDGLTKLEKLNFATKAEQQAESFR